MSKNNVVKLAGRDTIIDPLTELLRTGAEQLICQAVEAELLELLAEHSERRTADGKAGVVRNEGVQNSVSAICSQRDVLIQAPLKVNRQLRQGEVSVFTHIEPS